MREIKTFNELTAILTNNDKKVLYTMTHGCKVCHADYPRVDKLLINNQTKGYFIMADTIPEAAGQLNLYTSPVVILFNGDREYHRQARIIDFKELDKRIKHLTLEY